MTVLVAVAVSCSGICTEVVAAVLEGGRSVREGVVDRTLNVATRPGRQRGRRERWPRGDPEGSRR